MASIRWKGANGKETVYPESEYNPGPYMAKPEKGDVVIIGAGFTKALTDHAPVMADFINKAFEKGIYKPNGRHQELGRIIRSYFGEDVASPVNIEDLATFLVSESRMGFDFFDRERAYKDLVEIIEQTLSDLSEYVENSTYRDPCYKFVYDCIYKNIPIIGFNYDLVMDNILNSFDGWNPVFGYGGELDISIDYISSSMDMPPIKKNMERKKVDTYFLKLHGSLNWGIRKIAHPDGSKPLEITPEGIPLHGMTGGAIGINPIRHSTVGGGGPIGVNFRYDPFIIPPLANKGSMYGHNFVSYIWSLASHALAQAKNIYFLGYSLPSGDFETINLLRESIGNPIGENDKSIYVVDPSGKGRRSDLHCRFSEKLGQIGEGQDVYHLKMGVEEWLGKLYV